LADRPGALKRISIVPAGRLGYPGFGAAGVFAWPASAVHGLTVARTAPPAVAAAACNHSLRPIVVIRIPSRRSLRLCLTSLIYDKRADIHEAFLSLGCALICWQSLRKSWMTA
jgi:hypothetical protein